ncbi:MAG: hypothetical protein ABI823_11615 [Bryobacteraceae bacterium]
MHFPRFWALGQTDGFSSWRSSDLSFEDAYAHARQAAARIRDRVRSGAAQPEKYGYADRPLREQILHEMRDATGALSAVVSRNSCGCHVLNTANAMFVDIDLEDTGKRVEDALDRAKSWAYSHPGWNWRVYRTRAGLRLLATHALFDSRDPACQAVFQAVDADPLYRKLCGTQQSFRARLTPKPWRCGIQAPAPRWPYLDPRFEAAFQKWDAKYQHAANGYATCQLLPDLGSGLVAEDVKPIIALHDNVTRASSGLPLA